MQYQRFLCVFVFCYLGMNFSYAEKLSLSIDAEAAILINAESGVILYEKNAHKACFPASITKIATTLFVLKEKGDHLDQMIAADQESIASISVEAKKRSNYSTPSHWIERASTHMGIKKGEEFTLKDLLMGVMVVSANDASNVVAQYTSGSIPNFVIEMNNFLKSLGCKETNFTNPHGLHHPKHQTTPYDMAMIAREAMKDPIFRELAASLKFVRPKTNKQEPLVILQKNRLLRAGRHFYPKATGIKIGYTSLARHNIVASAKDGDRELIAVLMKCNDSGQMYKDAINLFDAAFNQAKMQKIVLKTGPQKFTCQIEGAENSLKTYIKENLAYEYYPAEEPNVKCYLQWETLTLPIMKDQLVGELQLKTTQGVVIQKIALYAEEPVHGTWFQWLKNII